MKSRIRWPAEWETQQVLFSAWPYLSSEWLDLFAAENTMIALCEALSSGSDFFLARDSNAVLPKKLSAAVRTRKLHYGDIWCRDTAPVFVYDENRARVAVVFRWTGWGNKYRLEGDDTFGPAIAELFNVRVIRSELACEGGALETDGSGTIITTRDCLLAKERNPSMSSVDVERELGRTLGATKVIWLERGLAGDHTDGHVDNLARFVGSAQVLCATSDASDPNHTVHMQIRAELVQARDASGHPLEVISVPSPGLIPDLDGNPLAASYLNFVISNNTVCVPQFGRPSDAEALETISAFFPTRAAIGIVANALLYGGGALHCVTNHVPAELT